MKGIGAKKIVVAHTENKIIPRDDVVYVSPLSTAVAATANLIVCKIYAFVVE